MELTKKNSRPVTVRACVSCASSQKRKVKVEAETGSRVLAIQMKEAELLRRERGLDRIEVRERALKLQGAKAAQGLIETERKEEAARVEVEEWKRKSSVEVEDWKRKCRKKEEERSQLEARYVERMNRDGYVVLASGGRLCKGDGGGLGEHALVVEGVLEAKMAELKEEKDRFIADKAQWESERDEWTRERIEAGVRSRELELYASCLEKGVHIEHSRVKRGLKSVEAEKRKLEKALDRGRHTKEELARAEDALAQAKHRRRMEKQQLRRAALESNKEHRSDAC